MKTIKTFLLLLLFAIILTFAYQNLEVVHVTFIKWSITVPFSLTIFLAFIAGGLAGVLSVFLLRTKKKEVHHVEKTESKPESKPENKPENKPEKREPLK